MKKTKNNKTIIYSMKEYEQLTGVRFTLDHTGKMEGNESLSTSCKCNKQCEKNAKVDGSICQKCYADKMLSNKFYGPLEKKLSKNYQLLNERILDKVPFINAAFFRFEAFGDIASETQFINYLNIATYNKHCSFAIWTKNPHILDSVFNELGYKKPKNLIVIVSSLFINKTWNFNNMPYADRYWFIDKIFTVYDDTYIKENNIEINCNDKDNKPRRCMDCLKCYTKNNIKYINEKLK